MRVTDQRKWERTKNGAAYIGWFTCITYYAYQYNMSDSFKPTVDLPAIIIILSVARMAKILIKEG